MAAFAAEGTGNFEPQAPAPAPPAAKHPVRIILMVEATAAAATNSKTARKWIDVLLKKIDADARGTGGDQGGAAQAAAAGDEPMRRIQYALVVYGSWDRSTQAALQYSSWCSTLPELLEWLNGVQFVGGNLHKGTALTEALAQAIIMSKCPYPDGSHPAPAGPTHPQPASAQESGLTAHTHVWLVCSGFNPCRLPIPWACEPDTKAALASTFYPAFLAKFETMIQQLRVHQTSASGNSSSVFSSFEGIRQSLQPPITPGTADIWDLTFSLARHRLSLSILSGMHKQTTRSPGSEQYRSCVELFCYANACLSIPHIKQACKMGLMGWQVAQAALLMSPLHQDAFKTGLQNVSKLLAARNAKQQRDAQQQQQQQSQQSQAQQAQATQQPQAQPAVATPPQQGYPAASQASQAPQQPPQQQQLQQPQQPQAQAQAQQLTAQQQQQLAQAMMQRQQAQAAQQQQQQAQQQQQQQQQQQMQRQQQQAQQAQQQQQQQQQQQPQQWMQAAQAAAVRPNVQQAMQQQQQQQAAQAQAQQAVANRQQQQAGQMGMGVQQAGMMPQQQQHQAMMLQQQQQQAQQKQAVQQQGGMQPQQQPQQQQQQQPQQQAGRYGMAVPSMGMVMMGQQQQQQQQVPQQQQQLGQMGGQMVSQAQVFVPAGQGQPQQMMLQPPQQQQQQPMAMGGFMQQQPGMAGMQGQMVMPGMQVNLHQQQMQMPAQATAAAGGGTGQRARQAFFQGTLFVSLPGVPTGPLADVELLASNAAAMATAFSNRGTQIVATKTLALQDIKQFTTSGSWRVSRGSFRVVNPHANFGWLQGQVHSRPDQQVMLEGQIGGLVTVFTFGQQSAKQQPQQAAQTLNLMEGSVIFCLPLAG